MTPREKKQQLLNKLYEPYKKCLKCPLGNLGRTNVVFGYGNPDARLMFIGEGPGADEDIQGKPFIGRSGKLLTKVLNLVGINREDVFITNIVKCRPPANRKPTPSESKTCKNLLLHQQIALIKPDVICTLGAAALEGLFEKKFRITHVRGSIMEFQGVKLIPAFHPAYILRNQKKLNILYEDIKMAYSHVLIRK